MDELCQIGDDDRRKTVDAESKEEKRKVAGADEGREAGGRVLLADAGKVARMAGDGGADAYGGAEREEAAAEKAALHVADDRKLAGQRANAAMLAGDEGHAREEVAGRDKEAWLEGSALGGDRNADQVRESGVITQEEEPSNPRPAASVKGLQLGFDFHVDLSQEGHNPEFSPHLGAESELTAAKLGKAKKKKIVRKKKKVVKKMVLVEPALDAEEFDLKDQLKDVGRVAKRQGAPRVPEYIHYEKDMERDYVSESGHDGQPFSTRPPALAGLETLQIRRTVDHYLAPEQASVLVKGTAPSDVRLTSGTPSTEQGKRAVLTDYHGSGIVRARLNDEITRHDDAFEPQDLSLKGSQLKSPPKEKLEETSVKVPAQESNTLDFHPKRSESAIRHADDARSFHKSNRTDQATEQVSRQHDIHEQADFVAVHEEPHFKKRGYAGHDASFTTKQVSSTGMQKWMTDDRVQ